MQKRLRDLLTLSEKILILFILRSHKLKIHFKKFIEIEISFTIEYSVSILCLTYTTELTGLVSKVKGLNKKFIYGW